MTIYQVTKEYLIKHFDPHCHTCIFTDAHTHELNALILALDPTYEAKKFEKKEQVRLAFIDFYIDVAKVTVFFKGMEKIIVKTTPYETHPDEHAYIAGIGAYVQSIVDELDKVNDSEEVLLIPDAYLQAMYAQLKSISIPVDARQLIRRAIHDAFKLNERDMILFINQKVIIKFYCEERETTCERRMEGLPEEEFRLLIDSLYPEDGESALETDIEMVLATLMDTALDFTKIDNHAFITHHIKIIQNALINFMKTKLSHPDIIINGVAKYIFREAFYFIHELLAEKLLELAARSNKNAEAFLKFYNGERVIVEGKKFVTPEIIDDNRHHWNLSEITNFMLKYSREDARLKSTEESLVARVKERDGTILEHKRALEQEKIMRGDIDKAYGEFKKIAKRSTANDEAELKAYVENLEKSHRSLQQKIEALNVQTLSLGEKIEKEKANLTQMRQKFVQQAEQYDLLVSAISNVLMAR